MLGLHTGSNPRLMRGTTLNEKQELEQPLTTETITTVLRYLAPPSNQIIPSLLLAEQLRRRHHFLSISPSDTASYLCLNPDRQDTNHVLSTLQQLNGQIPEQLIGRIAYFSDGEDLTAHVILQEAQNAIQICFDWEIDSESGIGGWRYLDVRALPLPKDAFDTLKEAQDARAKGRTAGPVVNGAIPSPGGLAAEDSYWSRYDNVAPSVANGRASADGRPRMGIPRNGSGTGWSNRSLSPRREEAYWDQYGYMDDDDEDGGPSLAAPVPAARPNLNILSPPANQFVPTQVWTGTSARFNPEDLSEALAMHLQPDLAPSSDIAQGLSLNLNTPPLTAPSYISTIDLSSPVSDRFQVNGDIGERTNGAVRHGGKNGTSANGVDDKAVSEAVRGVFQLWRGIRQAQGRGTLTPMEEKDVFLSLVSQAVAGL